MIGKLISTFIGFAIVLLLLLVLIDYIPGSQIPILGNNTISLPYPTTTTSIAPVPRSQAIAYALSVVNNDRKNYSLTNVTLSSETSGQQHADSMLANNYFSHWDIYGMKPYMRYTLVGGNQSVDENVAYIFNSSGINVLNALKTMEFNMMYRDQACCNNGHRNNILTGHHNQISIGVAYNTTTVYLVEDFVDNHISWFYGTPSYSGSSVNLQGTVANNFSFSNRFGVQVAYDSPVQNLTPLQLHGSPYNGSYGYGNIVAGVSYISGGVSHYYQGVMNLNASTYVVQGQKFDVSFDMSRAIAQYGAGEYTVIVFLSNSTDPNSSSVFYGATYTIFINSKGQSYVPQNV